MGRISSEQCATVFHVYGFRAANKRSHYVCQCCFSEYLKVCVQFVRTVKIGTRFDILAVHLGDCPFG